MSDTRYLVGMFESVKKVEVLGREVPIKLEWAEGMVGVIPVFESRETAEKYASGKYRVMMIETEKVSAKSHNTVSKKFTSRKKRSVQSMSKQLVR